MYIVCGGEMGGPILGRYWDNSLKSFPPCYSKSPLLMDFTPPPHPLNKSGLKLVCNVNIVNGHLKSENSQDNAQKPQWNCTFMNSASGLVHHTNNFLVSHSRPTSLMVGHLQMSQVKYGDRSPKFIWAPVYRCTYCLRHRNYPLPPHWGSYARALLVTMVS